MFVENHKHNIAPVINGRLLLREEIDYFRLDTTNMWVLTGRCNLGDCEYVTYEQIGQPKITRADLPRQRRRGKSSKIRHE